MKISKLAKAMLAILGLLLIVCSGCDQVGTMIITGTVTDFETGAPVENLELCLYTYEAHQAITVFSRQR